MTVCGYLVAKESGQMGVTSFPGQGGLHSLCSCFLWNYSAVLSINWISTQLDIHDVLAELYIFKSNQINQMYPYAVCVFYVLSFTRCQKLFAEKLSKVYWPPGDQVLVYPTINHRTNGSLNANISLQTPKVQGRAQSHPLKLAEELSYTLISEEHSLGCAIG